ncbi:MAG: exodeoxyribonuclease V subunit beta [Methylococcaceae bacterium]|nr:exodeoxyribonuclease V subunit beta [Methylococcaceae bacterium]
MSIKNFQPTTTELKTGINLIEASAGTGKTYAIAMLVLRFVVEKDLNIEQLLVVTFTKAATEELKDRIRARLAEAKQAAYGRRENAEKSVLEWLDALAIDKAIIKQRLEAALLNIDQAGIFTIHGFCQRILSEHALESGQLFDFELTADIHSIKQRCADDYWRKQLYPRNALQVSLLTAEYSTPESLLNSIESVSLSSKAILPAAKNLESLLENVEQLINQAQGQFNDCYQTLNNSFEAGKFKDKYSENFDEVAANFKSWLEGGNLSLPEPEALALFSDTGVSGGLNGAKFRKTNKQSGEERKSEYLDELALENSAFNDLADEILEIALHFRLGLLDDLRISVDEYLQQLNQLSFDDLISRLASALKNDEQQLLTQALQQRFSVALIDEFQDTDDQQWDIFRTLFTAKNQYMYLIGDPKQAIYKFRGADIFSYFSAKDTAQHHFTLGHNWRSHPQLVTAVNKLFERDQAFLFEKLPFNDVAAARKINDGDVHYKEESIAPMMLWQLGESDNKTGDWTSGKAAEEIKTAVVNEILELLNQAYTLKIEDNHRDLKPKDIAILVRSNRQARDYQAALQKQGVPAVLNSIESVFAVPQAFELYQLLQAVSSTGDMRRLKQALTLDWFGLEGQSFYALMNNEAELDAWVSRFSEYHLLWQQQGLMAMMSRLLAHEKVHSHLAALPLAERILSNLHHLIELLQETASEQHLGIEKTLEYLAQTIQDAEGGSEEQQLRLESDDEAVKIVTMHRSKGLEYAVVFCPFLWQSNERLKQEQELIKCHVDGNMINDLGSNEFEKHKLLALNEQLAEDLRILYVALTRAKYRCYIAWANVRTKNSPNNSALAYLMDFYFDDFDAQHKKLKVFQDEQPDVFAYELLEPKTEISGYYQTQQQIINPVVKKRSRYFDSHWQMSSYTALAALTKEEAPDLPEDKAQESDDEPLTINNYPLTIDLPRGSHTGNVIHSLLEFNSFKKLAEPETDISLQRDKTCQRYGLRLENPEVINQLLQTVVSTPLSVDDEEFCLKNLEYWQCVKEMPFYLAVNDLDVEDINKLLAHCPTYQALNKKQLAGYLTGFIDLICEYEGRYYVMDYKTNYLLDYRTETMTAAMREHNYGLQYWLYSVVLHLYLKNRLPDYNYQQHFGGVRYLFVRGMQAAEPLSGIYEDFPDLETLDALVVLFE